MRSFDGRAALACPDEDIWAYVSLLHGGEIFHREVLMVALDHGDAERIHLLV